MNAIQTPLWFPDAVLSRAMGTFVSFVVVVSVLLSGAAHAQKSPADVVTDDGAVLVEKVGEDDTPADEDEGAPVVDDANAEDENEGAESASTGEVSNDENKTSSAGVPPLVTAAVDEFRTPVDRLAEHYLGSTSRPVRFDWRQSTVILGLQGGELIERNNFGSFRIGGLVRKAFMSIMVEGAVSYVLVVGTESSQLLALTPYRQPSRPSRIELDINVSYPIFEGVVTPLFDFIPPSEMTFSVTGGGRYLLYPQTIIGDRNWNAQRTWTNTDTWRDIGAGLATASMLDDDRIVLERRALGGMAVDPALVHTLAGFTFDTYYQPGLFVSARALLNIPALAAATNTSLGFWWEMTVAAGWAF